MLTEVRWGEDWGRSREVCIAILGVHCIMYAMHVHTHT